MSVEHLMQCVPKLQPPIASFPLKHLKQHSGSSSSFIIYRRFFQQLAKVSLSTRLQDDIKIVIASSYFAIIVARVQFSYYNLMA